MEFPKCSKDASSLAKRVSLLNFEPEVSKFPVIGTANAVSITTATGKFLFVCHHKMGDVLKLEMKFPESSKNAISLAKASLIAKFQA